jgi:hypothetical protein
VRTVIGTKPRERVWLPVWQCCQQAEAIGKRGQNKQLHLLVECITACAATLLIARRTVVH